MFSFLTLDLWNSQGPSTFSNLIGTYCGSLNTTLNCVAGSCPEFSKENPIIFTSGMDVTIVLVMNYVAWSETPGTDWLSVSWSLEPIEVDAKGDDAVIFPYFTDEVLQPANLGGGVFFSTCALLSLRRCSFVNNSAQHS